MYRSKKKRNYIIIGLCAVLFLMGVGYAAFNTELKISGTSKVTSNWDTNKVTTMYKMFYNTSNLRSIYVGPNWTTANASTIDMFTGSRISSVTTGQC